MEVPVYLVNGFLESGKTLFIDDALKSEDFADGDKTLLIACEEGMEEYDEKRKIRLEVRPGITGYSQAYFRNSISNEEKLEKDAFYARNVTFGGDLKIIFATVNTVVFRKNIYNKKNR